jgi:hypothetical protein
LDSLISIAYQIQEFSKSSREGFWPDKVRKNAGEQSAVQVFADFAFFCGDSIRVHRFFRGSTLRLRVSAVHLNPGFKPIEFERFRKQAGLNSSTLTPKQWIGAPSPVASRHPLPSDGRGIILRIVFPGYSFLASPARTSSPGLKSFALSGLRFGFASIRGIRVKNLYV